MWAIDQLSAERLLNYFWKVKTPWDRRIITDLWRKKLTDFPDYLQNLWKENLKKLIAKYPLELHTSLRYYKWMLEQWFLYFTNTPLDLAHEIPAPKRPVFNSPIELYFRPDIPMPIWIQWQETLEKIEWYCPVFVNILELIETVDENDQDLITYKWQHNWLSELWKQIADQLKTNLKHRQ